MSGGGRRRAPAIVIDVSREPGVRAPGAAEVRRVARLALRGATGRLASVSIAFVTNVTIARLNRRFLAHRGATDVINFAAESHVDRSIQDSGPFVRTNVIGTQVLLDAAREFGVAKYVQVSTDEVYGSLGPTGLFVETTPYAPNSPYSASKASSDMLVRAYHLLKLE